MEVVPPLRERTVLAVTVEDAVAVADAIREPALVKVHRIEERKYVVRITSGVMQ